MPIRKISFLGLIRTKNRSGLEKLCADLALPEGDTEKLMKVSGLYGEFGRCWQRQVRSRIRRK